jgi:cbb3-type cytochrome oxidase cytochrome c subunit
MQLALMVFAGGIILFLAVLFIYASVSPGTSIRSTPHLATRSGHPCIYCHSTDTRRLSQEPRYDRYGFALVTSYECMRCGFPFWSVDRSPAQQHSR